MGQDNIHYFIENLSSRSGNFFVKFLPLNNFAANSEDKSSTKRFNAKANSIMDSLIQQTGNLKNFFLFNER